MSGAYYNEIDPFAAQWLRNLIAAGHIAQGEVDERSIVNVSPADLRGFTQCHFFAGIGVWSYAARLAGWDDGAPLWSASCPCQPFSDAGAGKGFSDERHLWPAVFELIRECRPVVVVGEQVASKSALAWLDHVCADLEGADYAVGAVDTCAAGHGAPHIRQRLYWVADDNEQGLGVIRSVGLSQDGNAQHWPDADRCGADGGVGNDVRSRLAQQQCERVALREDGGANEREAVVGDGAPTNGFWRPADWIECRDGKARPIEPGTFPLAHGATQRVGRLRAYGNSLVAPQAAEFIRAVMT